MAECRVMVDLRINGEPVSSFPHTVLRTGEALRLDRTHDTADEQNSHDGGVSSAVSALVFSADTSVDLGAAGMLHAFNLLENACVILTENRNVAYDPSIGSRVQGLW